MGGKVLLVQDIDSAGKRLLLENGLEIITAEKEDAGLVKSLIADCDAVFSKTFFLSEDILKAGKRLKVVAKHGSGVDNVVDTGVAAGLGIYVVNTPYANTVSVAEHAICGMLAFAEKTLEMHKAVQAADFSRQNCGGMFELHGKTVGIIGLGNIGRAVAKIAALGFEMKVLGYDPFVPSEKLCEYIQRTDDIQQIYKEADFVALHLSASESTNGLVGRAQLEMMKKTAVLLNFSRGSVVDEAALIDALEGGEIAGAVLDVFSAEPVEPDNPLLKMENVLLSPHSAALTDEALVRMSIDGASGIIDILSGRRPKWCVNYDSARENAEKRRGGRANV